MKTQGKIKTNGIFLFVVLNITILPTLSAQEFRIDQVEHASPQSEWSMRDYDLYTFESYDTFDRFQREVVFSDIDYPLLHAAIFFETNRTRSLYGLPPLEWNINLEITAYNHSQFMVNQYEFAHYSGSSERRTPNDRASLAGIINPQINENIAIIFALDYEENTPFYSHGRDMFSYNNNPADLIQALSYSDLAKRAAQLWLDSPSHRANMLSPQARQLGTGAYFYRDSNSGYFPKFRITQNFQWWNAVTAESSIDPLPPGFQFE